MNKSRHYEHKYKPSRGGATGDMKVNEVLIKIAEAVEGRPDWPHHQ